MMGVVYWITGLSGAGKTTIGKKLYDEIKLRHSNTVFLDGDELRNVFGNDLGYSNDDRKKCAMRYARLCDMLQKQDINVICCTISMFESIREWNRKNIVNYREIYVKVDIGILIKRNQKGLYSSILERSSESVGLGVEFEEPENPDMVLINNGELTVEDQVNKIMEKFCV